MLPRQNDGAALEVTIRREIFLMDAIRRMRYEFNEHILDK